MSSHGVAMQQPERRIRCLRLSGPGHVQLRQARNLIEEAFRTASLPGVPPNAQVVFKRLDLGRLSLNEPPSRLAGRIGSLVRNLAAGAVCVDEATGAAAEAVWFSDPLRPYQVLLLELLKGSPPGQWYWKSLFPHRDPGLNAATVGWLLLESAQTPLKGLGPAHLLQTVVKAGLWPKLLPLITPSLARRMLNGAGVGPGTAGPPRSRGRGPAGERAGLIPPPAMDSGWHQALKLAVQSWGAEDVRPGWLAWQALILHQPAWKDRADALRRIRVAAWLEQGDPPGRSSDARRNAPIPAGLRRAKDGPALKRADRGTGGSSKAKPPLQSPLQQSPAPAGPEEGGRDGSRGAVSGDVPGSGRTPEAPVEQGTQSRDQVPFSNWAGFALLIPVLERIGLDELLQRNEQLIIHDFPGRLLQAMAERFAVPDEDPVCGLFDRLQPEGHLPLEGVRLPESWKSMTTGSGRPLQRGPGSSLIELMRTTQLIAGLSLRRHGRISLRRLVKRPGRVALTTTHWDVLFDLNQTDIRLRRAALDTDPGWVAWLGLVVQYHYLSRD